MSSSNIFRIPLTLANIDVFTFGESSLYGYDSLNHCLIVYSLNDLNNLTSSPIHLHLSSSPPSSIKKLILNPNQTILALISDKTAHFVYLPQLNNSPSKNTRLCLLNILSPLDSNSSQLTNTLIDFLWLSPNHFVIVNSCPSSNECHLYRICPSKHSIIEYLQTFSVGLSFRGQIRKSGTPNKSISLQQPENIIKLDLAKRKQDQLILILLFALKDNGDMFLLEIDENQLINNENYLYGEFIGPLRILPSTYNNYGSNYRHSKFLCLSCSENALVVFTPNLNELNQCILLNPSNETYCLYTIDSINLPKTSEKISLIKSMIKNPLNSNIYYISDSLSNVYSIEISWINQIDQKSNEIRSTNIQYLCKSEHSIEQIALIQRNNKGQWLAILTNTSQQNQQKELILLRPNSSSISSTNIIESRSSFEPIKTNQSNLPSEFLERIHSILRHDQTLPRVTLSSSQTNISNEDFQKNLYKFLQLFTEDYLEKQEKVRLELQNKEKYLNDFQEIQLIAKQELEQKFQQIQNTFQTLTQQYQQECSRRKDLSSNVDDLLSIVEQHTPVVSNAEILMHQQLERYEIEINALASKIELLRPFISPQSSLNSTGQKIDQSAMNNIQEFVQYFQNEISQMKEQLHRIDQQN